MAADFSKYFFYTKIPASSPLKHTLYPIKHQQMEHRLFAHISRSWSGASLLCVEQARKKAEETTSSKGLLVHADINNKTYNTKMPFCKSYELLRQKHIVFDDILPKWNYVVKYMAAE